VVALDERPPEGAAFDPNVTWLAGSVQVEADLTRALETLPAGEAVLFHLAGWSHVEQCENDPAGARALNVEAALNVAGLWRAQGYSKMVFPSTALVYAPACDGRSHEEDDPVQPAGVYTQNKLEAEQRLCALARVKGLSIEIARLSQIYGPGAAGDTVVAQAIGHALAGDPPVMRKPGEVLDFIHVQDVAEGLLRLALLPETVGCQVVNLSSGRGHSVGQMAEMVRQMAGIHEGSPQVMGQKAANKVLVLNNTRLKALTGWQPEYDLAAGLAQTWQEMKGRRG
jgi:nucleoside-diphosphate-sugar epimerase